LRAQGRSASLRGVTLRRFLPLAILIALIAAPFARASAAGTMMPGHAMAMAGHCEEMLGEEMTGEDMPASQPGKADMAMIDCMIACAAIGVPGAPQMGAAHAGATLPEPRTLPSLAGLDPGADPPPPRAA